ncbi:hypothetical protein HT031_004387 [Scenedesmus sp. PABB004]|nr:hypothetical protein HT031_004387 [Scenedesmus sp. PABB004]
MRRALLAHRSSPGAPLPLPRSAARLRRAAMSAGQGPPAPIPERAHAVLAYWFGPDYATQTDPRWWTPAEQGAARWYKGGPAVDAHITAEFKRDVEALASGALDEWQASPWPAAAGIILADQFTRNIYRGSARAFELDAKALAWARALQDSGAAAAQLPGVVRSFVNTPFMHSERLEDQQRCVDVAERELAAARALDPASPAAAAWAAQVQFASAHRDVIARWGRFPHRNAMLGRESTPEEEAGLADGSIGRW